MAVTLLGSAPPVGGGGGLYDGAITNVSRRLLFTNLVNASTSGRGSWFEIPTADSAGLYDFTGGTGLVIPVDGFVVCQGANSNATAARIMDVGRGPSGSQVVLQPDIVHGADVDFNFSYFTIRRPVAAGQRLWVRQYNSTANSQTWVVLIPLFGQPTDAQPYVAVPLNLGADAVLTSLGTSVTQSALASYTQIVASTVEDYEAVTIKLIGRTGTSAWGTVHLAVGGAGSEVPVATWMFGGQTGNPQPDNEWRGVHIPAGSRLSLTTYASSGGSDAWRVVAYGIKEA